MDLFSPIVDLISRVGSYPLWAVALELVLILVVVVALIRFVQGTRAAGALKGMLLVIIAGTIIVQVLGRGGSFERIGYLYDRLIALVAIMLVVVFQPELRRALMRLGERNWFGAGQSDLSKLAGEVADACAYLAKSRFGAIIVIERRLGLRAITEGGTIINGAVSAQLLQTIFYPGSALHDLAVVMRGGRIHSAGVQLPMASSADMPDQSFGSRHRAAVGITKDSDALVIVVSEETGLIRMAERGMLSAAIDPMALEDEIVRRLGVEVVDDEEEAAVAEAMSTAGTEVPTNQLSNEASEKSTGSSAPAKPKETA